MEMLSIFYRLLFSLLLTTMSVHDQDKEKLRACLTQAQMLVGDKVEIKEEGWAFILFSSF